MKAALALLLFPCLAFGRVGEKLDDFLKRAGVKPEREKVHKNGLTESYFIVEGITVQILAVNGVIAEEHYSPVNKTQAFAIVFKASRDLMVDVGRSLDAKDKTFWTKEGSSLRAVFDGESLLVTDGSAGTLLKESETDEARRKVEKF